MEKCKNCQALTSVMDLMKNQRTLIAEQQKIIEQLLVHKAIVDMIKQGGFILN